MADNFCPPQVYRHPDQPHLGEFRQRFGKSADEIVFRAAELFLLGQEDAQREQSADDVADRIVEEFELGDRFTRRDVYPAIRAAVELGLLVFRAPVQKELARRLRAKFPLDRVRFHVVNSHGATSEFLAERAAEVVFRQIRLIYGKRVPNRGSKKPVGIGMGPGASTLIVCRSLASLLKDIQVEQSVRIFGISSGCPPNDPALSPISFFNLLPRHVIHGTLALLTDPLIPAVEYEDRKSEVGLREVFAAKDDVDIVLTSMGDCHEHDELLTNLLQQTPDFATKNGWIGSVQYRFFSATGPIYETGTEKRVATLFELSDLVRMAKPNSGKAVVLIARPCAKPGCGFTKARALFPLLTQENLRVFNHLVLDSNTALELLRL